MFDSRWILSRVPLLMVGMVLVFSAQPSQAQPVTVDIRDYGRLLRILGEEDGERFGIHLDVAQLPGRSKASLFVGADFGNNQDDDDVTGRLYLFDGETLPSTGLIDLREQNFAPRATFFGEQDNSHFGTNSRLGDYDGDGVLDIAISAPEWEDDGRVYLYFGGVALPNTGQFIWQTTGDILAVNAHVIFEGYNSERPGQTFTSGDYDGDGIEELVIGAPKSRDDHGRVYVIRGRSDWTIPNLILLRETWDNPDEKGPLTTSKSDIRVFVGDREQQSIGESLATGDLNGDGRQDLLIGADHETIVYDTDDGPVNLLEVGRVHVLSGNNVFPVVPATAETALTVEVSDFIITGKSEFDLFGDELLVTRWDSDSIDDVWISSPFAEPTPLGNDIDDNGIVSLVLGSTSHYSSGKTSREMLFSFALDWKQEGYQPEDLVEEMEKQIGPDLFPPLVAGEIRYPTGMAKAIVGPLDEPLFGGSLSTGDILTNFSGNELLVGASRDDPEDDENAGTVSVFSHFELLIYSSFFPFQTELQHESVRIRGEEELDRFGFRVRSADLFDGPGEELIVTAPQASTDIRTSGVVYILNAMEMGIPVGASETPTYAPTATPAATWTPTPEPGGQSAIGDSAAP